MTSGVGDGGKKTLLDPNEDENQREDTQMEDSGT